MSYALTRCRYSGLSLIQQSLIRHEVRLRFARRSGRLHVCFGNSHSVGTSCSQYLPVISLQVPIIPVPFRDSLPIPNGDAQPDNASGRIVGGELARLNQFPYQVGLRIVSDNYGSSICGASLISTSWVLSAAHCTYIYDAQVNMRIGSNRFSDGGILQVATHIFNHPSYRPATANHDVSLLRVPSPVTVSAAVRPVRLPASSQVSDPMVGQRPIVSGWGAVTHGGSAQETLRYATVRVITNAECRQTFPDSTVIDSVMCTVGDSNQSFCAGDSGGPLVLNEGGIPTQVGIVSFNAPAWRGGCSVGLPSGYMRTASQLTWIRQMTGLAIR